MVVKNRISYIRRVLEMGAKLTITVSHNDVTGVDKFKVIIDPSTRVDPSYQGFAKELLDILDNACNKVQLICTRTEPQFAVAGCDNPHYNQRKSRSVLKAQ